MRIQQFTSFLLLAGLFLLSSCSGRNVPVAYYVDSEQGDDQNAGTTPERAWKTLSRAGSAPLKAGEKLLL